MAVCGMSNELPVEAPSRYNHNELHTRRERCTALDLISRERREQYLGNIGDIALPPPRLVLFSFYDQLEIGQHYNESSAEANPETLVTRDKRGAMYKTAAKDKTPKEKNVSTLIDLSL